MSIETLTKRQRDVYEFVRDKIENRGYGPTVREIAERVGRSPDVVLKTVSGPRVYKGIRPIYEK